jgi:NAD(P)-dependent dehydrogenase (short-subunit alcohol dehydrogenase family)
MNIKDSVVLITGANRGLGLALADSLLQAGARKVYAGARVTSTVTRAGVLPAQLDVTNAADIAIAVRACADASIVINNAGIDLGCAVMAAEAAQSVRTELETNFFGPLAVSQAFAPVLARQGGGAIVNILSALSWVNLAKRHLQHHQGGGMVAGLERLSPRQGAKILMERFTANPTASIPMACHGLGEPCAAYCFLSTPDVEWRDVMVPH